MQLLLPTILRRTWKTNVTSSILCTFYITVLLFSLNRHCQLSWWNLRYNFCVWFLSRVKCVHFCCLNITYAYFSEVERDNLILKENMPFCLEKKSAVPVRVSVADPWQFGTVYTDPDPVPFVSELQNAKKSNFCFAYQFCKVHLPQSSKIRSHKEVKKTEI
jgi:hypothetical protein